MIACANLSQAQSGRHTRRSANFEGDLVPLLGAHPVPGAASPVGVDEPQAFLVLQNPGWVLRTHYHTEHQFQLVTGGAGVLGTHALSPLMLHYASPEAGYGPIRAGDDGLNYYTLRARGTRETWFLPDERERMQRGLAKHHAYGGPVLPSEPSVMCARTERCTEVLMAGVGGLGGWMLRLPAGEVVDNDLEDWDGVRFYYVAAGSIEWQGQRLHPGDVASAQDQADCFTARAAEGGAEVVVMQFPSRVTTAR